MRSREPRLNRLSGFATMLAFGLVAFVLPPHVQVRVAAATPQAAPAAPAAPVAEPTSRVLTDVPDSSPAAPVVALTFDDGPDPRWTPEVLRLLASNGAVATFCMIGAQADGHPDLVRSVVAAGMRLCDHSHSHDEHLATESLTRMTAEIAGTRADLSAAADAPVRYFRAPGGNWSPAMQSMASASGMQPLGWSVDPRDWAQPGVTAVVAAVQHQVHPGAIVLLHDGGGHRQQTVAALAVLLPWLTAHGYRFGFPTP